MLIEPLTTAHDRNAFDCGVESLNTYLRRYARQNADRDYGVTYIGTPSPGASLIDGYYTLAHGSVARAHVPEKGLPQYPAPTALLGRLAVDRRSQGRGVGQFLLFDALRRSLEASRMMGVYAVEVLALDDAACRFYARYGFKSLTDDPLHLYLPLKEVRKMGLEPG